MFPQILIRIWFWVTPPSTVKDHTFALLNFGTLPLEEEKNIFFIVLFSLWPKQLLLRELIRAHLLQWAGLDQIAKPKSIIWAPHHNSKTIHRWMVLTRLLWWVGPDLPASVFVFVCLLRWPGPDPSASVDYCWPVCFDGRVFQRFFGGLVLAGLILWTGLALSGGQNWERKAERKEWHRVRTQNIYWNIQ